MLPALLSGSVVVERIFVWPGLGQLYFDSILARLDKDFQRLTVVEIRPALIAQVPALVRKHPLRGYDAVQLAAALTLGARAATTVWASDGELLQAARSEGLQIVRV